METSLVKAKKKAVRKFYCLYGRLSVIQKMENF